MATTTTPTDPRVVAVLVAVEAEHHMESRAAAAKFALATDWAALHPGEEAVTHDIHGQPIPWGDRPLEIAGDGAPTIAEFAIAEFATAIKVSTDSARTLIGDAVETRHRLPRLWTRTMVGEVPVWKTRRIAQATRGLPLDGADFVDRQLARIAHTCSFAQIERTTAAAAAEYAPETAEEDREEASANLHVNIHLHDTTLDGHVHLEATLDLADALALEHALRDRAHALHTERPDLPLDTRRAIALGHLADHALTTDGTPREVVIHTHHDTRETHGLIGVDNTRSHITVEQLAEWCHQAGTRVTIRPVLDLDEEIHVPGYTPSDRQREQAVLTCPTCVFPHCTRPARGCDLDHITAYAEGGRTTSSNLAPLCRAHHRLKTHTAWTYHRLTRTSFQWTSPTGRTLIVDHTHLRRRTR